MSAQQQLFQTATRGFSFLFSFSFVSKLFTFAANTYIIRKLDPTINGMIFSLELLVLSVIFLSQESIRRACLRLDITSTEGTNQNKLQKEISKLINICWLIIPIGFVFTYLGYRLFLNYSNDLSATFSVVYSKALILYCISILIQLFAQIPYILAQNLLLYKLRISIEGTALTAKILTTIFLINSFYRDELSPIAFGYSQMTYGICILVGYYYYFYTHFQSYPLISLLPHSISIEKTNKPIYLDSHLLHLSFSFWIQTLIKFILTEGEKYILMFWSSLVEQGVYDVVSHLGSLAARILFQPIEEVGFTTWSKLLGKQEQLQKESITLSFGMLHTLLKFMILVGLIFVSFGPNYSHTLLELLYSVKWSSTSAPQVLSFYCVYVMFMAVNGITEAFVHAVSSKEQMKGYNMIMIAFSILYLLVASVLLHVIDYGLYGLIIANCFNMLQRIVYNFYFLMNYAKQHKQSIVFQQCLPNPLLWILFIVSFVMTYYAKKILIGITGKWLFITCHIGIGCICLTIILFTLLKKEREFIQQVKGLVGKK